jgi:hypothetical protein
MRRVVPAKEEEEEEEGITPCFCKHNKKQSGVALRAGKGSIVSSLQDEEVNLQ